MARVVFYNIELAVKCGVQIQRLTFSVPLLQRGFPRAATKDSISWPSVAVSRRAVESEDTIVAAQETERMAH